MIILVFIKKNTMKKYINIRKMTGINK